MKSLFLSALIIDQNEDSLNQFSKVIKEIFSKVYIAKTSTEATKDFVNIKPQVVFFNFSIAQRKDQFELLSQMHQSENPAPIFFGYCDSIEPELLTHSLENGVFDLFARPFDADIISTKINRFYQSEKTLDRDLTYSLLRPPLPVQIKMKFKVSSVDESGITFQGDHYVSKGTHLRLADPLIDEIFQQKEMDFIVTRTWVNEDWKNYFFFIEPKDAKEQHNANLRKFILGKI